MSSLVARRITVRAPKAAPDDADALKATPGVSVVEVMVRTLEIVMSAGPVTETRMVPESPGPKSKTVLVSPRRRVPPVLEAVPPIPLEVPNTSAFAAGVPAGAGTTMSFPVAVPPGPTFTVMGSVTSPVPGGGGGGGDVGGVSEAPPPQPTAIARETRNTNRGNKGPHYRGKSFKGLAPILPKDASSRAGVVLLVNRADLETLVRHFQALPGILRLWISDIQSQAA